MPIAEIFLSAFITVLFEKLASGELLKLPSIKDVVDKIKKWRKDLAMINAVLGDAEEKQITDASVKLWLEELQDLAYDMDDMLDELNTDLSLHKEAESSASTSKVLKLFPSCCTSFTPSAFMLDARASRKIDEITARLDALMKQTDALRLTTSGGGRSDTVGQVSRATTSVVEESLVLGRAEEKAAICELLLEERKRSCDGEGRDVFVIPILGMGGLGKTTLAQLVYNDEQVKGHFDHHAWVCISDNFDLLRVSNLIYNSVAEPKEEFKDLNGVQVRLKEKLSNKKFLIVLDDVWDESYAKWDQFRVPFLVGAPESVIVVTTRIGRIAKFMGSMEAYALKPLQDDECTSLLAQHALSRPSFDMHPDLKSTGEEIARKCGGLPLAAKSLGGVLRTKTSLKQWKKVLTSKIWDLDTQSDDVLPALRLSYHHLPPHLKPLFVYCSIFPKDYEFQKDDLILLWMAQGLVTQTGENMPMEELGSEYFNELLSRSFFSDAKSENDEEPMFLMHDLINDLALFVAGSICCRLDEKMESKVQSSFSEKVRHSSFIRQRYGTFRKFMPYSKGLHLRTFLPIADGDYGHFYLSNKVSNELLPKLRYLRVMSLSGYEINELPGSIGDLKHLRYLNMSYTNITQLPESVCKLYNLQTLVLRSCHNLNQLPNGIRNLVNLRHLDIARTSELKWMPYGIGTLSGLCTLPKVIISKTNGFQLIELKGLPDLKGTLVIIGMQYNGSIEEAREANLVGKGGLDNLEMRWEGNFEDCQDEGTERRVLDVLKPQPGLKRLDIAYYGGTSFPSWVGDPSFSCMVHLKLSGCKKCTSLPSLGHLPSLRELLIEEMDGVIVVGAEFFGDGSKEVGVFPSLKILSFFNMLSWEEWSSNFINGAENLKAVFPRLVELTLCRCKKLVKVCLPQIPSLGELSIWDCSEALLRSMVDLASVKTFTIRAIAGLTQLDEGIISSFGALEELSISDCSELRYLWQDEVSCVILSKLRELKICGCGRLVSLGEKEQVLPRNLRLMILDSCDSLEKIPNCCESLRELKIFSCKKLKYFQSTMQILPKTENNEAIATVESSSRNNDKMEGFHNLETLTISKCPSLTCLPTGKKLPSTLKHLYIGECEKLKEPAEEKTENNEAIATMESSSRNNDQMEGFHNLETLTIFECPRLTWLPTGKKLPSTLKHLSIDTCENMEEPVEPEDSKEKTWLLNSMSSLESICFSGWANLKPLQEGCFFGFVDLTHLFIAWCEGIKSIPKRCLPPCLRVLLIQECKNLESFSLCGNELESLEELEIIDCENLEFYPTGGAWPPNLKSLTMGDVKQPITELPTLPTSLTALTLKGDFPELVSLSDVGSRLPTSLTLLEFRGLVNLKSLSDGLQNLTSLEHFNIKMCPKLRSLPDMLLPALSSLIIKGCPLMKERVGKVRGDYWARIAHIPCLEINNDL